ncbi:MAG: lysophospholipid acyltransferase family protein [Pseudomonadota bacterium]
MAGGGGIARWLRASPTGRALASRLCAAYIRLVTRTTRWHVEGKDAFDAMEAAEKNGIVAAIWHGRLFMSPTYAPVDRRRTIAMISNNHDGELIAAIVRRFDVDAVRGSTYDRAKRRDKGGIDAYHGALDGLQQGALVAITPDGPRGPRMRAQTGAAQLSLETGAPVIPVAFSVRWGRVLRSWDRFLLPLPFGRGAIVYGEVLRPEGPVEAFRARLEQVLTETTNRADSLCRRPAVPPGPPLFDDPGAESDAVAPRDQHLDAGTTRFGEPPFAPSKGQIATGAQLAEMPPTPFDADDWRLRSDPLPGCGCGGEVVAQNRETASHATGDARRRGPTYPFGWLLRPVRRAPDPSL